MAFLSKAWVMMKSRAVLSRTKSIIAESGSTLSTDAGRVRLSPIGPMDRPGLAMAGATSSVGTIKSTSRVRIAPPGVQSKPASSGSCTITEPPATFSSTLPSSRDPESTTQIVRAPQSAARPLSRKSNGRRTGFRNSPINGAVSESLRSFSTENVADSNFQGRLQTKLTPRSNTEASHQGGDTDRSER